MDRGRRQMLEWLGAAAVAAAPLHLLASAAPSDAAIRIGASARGNEDAQRGLDAGFREAQQTAGLLGRRVERVAPDAVAFAAIDGGGRDVMLRAAESCTFQISAPQVQRASALARWLVATGRRRCRTTYPLTAGVRDAFTSGGLSLSDTGAADAVVTSPRDSRDAGHDRALRVALAPLPGGEDAAWIAEWHASLVRFGASDLNELFTRAFLAPMTPRAWCAWVAVKASVEAALRATAPADACGALAALRFDGHKGSTLRFDRGVLVQPLCLVVREQGRERADFVEAGA